MRRRLPYAKMSRTDLALIAALAVLSVAPTLHVAAYARTKAAAELKSAYVLNWGADVWALQAAIRSGDLFNPEFLRMFSYGFLHTGSAHLVYNLVHLIPLWWITVRRMGGVWTVAIYLAGLVLSCLLHLISTPPGPITIGASGGVHFLFGLWAVWAFQDRVGSMFRRAWPSLLILTFVVSDNLFLISKFGSRFAWDLHLWGFVAGLFVARLLPKRATLLSH